MLMTPSNMKICPTCRGTGYFDEYSVQENNVKKTLVSSIGLQIGNCSEITHNRNTDEAEDMTHLNAAVSNVYIDKARKMNMENRVCSVIGNKDESLDFLRDPEKFENFQETLRLVVLKLKQNNWESSVSALLNVVHVARIHPEMVDSTMPLITRSLCSLMKNVRPQVIRTACQIAEELFKTMQCSQKPEFDELVSALLKKTAHMNKTVRQDANKALDAMGTYIQPSHCISAMSTCNGAGHKNSIVRTTVSRLLYNIVYAIGLETFLLASNLRDSRRRTFRMCIDFLNDPCIETRSNARRLVQLLMRHNDFDVVFNQDVDRSLIKKIEKQLIALKYDCSNPS